MKIEESLNVTFDETPPPYKTSPLVDDDLDEQEAIKVTERKNLENDIEDETLEVDEIVNIKESKNHTLDNVIGNLNQRTLRISWIVAMQEELNQFIANDVWELVPHPKSMTIIGTKWVYRNKLDENGIVSQNKASVFLCARFQEDPKTSHLKVVKRIFRYIKGTTPLGLWYPKGTGIETVVYAKSDHVGDYVDRKSTNGICTFVGCCLTSWFLKKQTALAISTTESEYVSAGKACQKALWMKQAIIDYNIRLDDVPIKCDNKGAIDLSKNPMQHSRTKHIEIHDHFLWDNVQKEYISIEKVSSEDNIVGILTKPLCTSSPLEFELNDLVHDEEPVASVGSFGVICEFLISCAAKTGKFSGSDITKVTIQVSFLSYPQFKYASLNLEKVNSLRETKAEFVSHFNGPAQEQDLDRGLAATRIMLTWQTLNSQCLEPPDKLALCGLDPAKLYCHDRMQENNKPHLARVVYSNKVVVMSSIFQRPNNEYSQPWIGTCLRYSQGAGYSRKKVVISPFGYDDSVWDPSWDKFLPQFYSTNDMRGQSIAKVSFNVYFRCIEPGTELCYSKGWPRPTQKRS
ncbi:hypothetical protein Tco_0755387 [Tanacetum coccineum]